MARKRRKKILGIDTRIALIGLVVAIIGVISGGIAVYFSAATYVTPPAAPPPQTRDGSIALELGTSSSFYPLNGVLPTARPPRYAATEDTQHCDEWFDWAVTNRAAPIGNSIDIEINSHVTSPITVKNISIRRISKAPLAQGKHIKCLYGAGGEMGVNVEVNLDNPSPRLPMDIDGDGESDTTIPGGVVVVETSQTGYITVYYTGEEASIYGIAISVTYSENGQERTARFGTAASPIHIATYPSEAETPDYVDWDYCVNAWTPAPDPGVALGGNLPCRGE